MTEIRLLGPIEVTAGGRVMEVGPPQRSMVLAALAVDAGRPVTVDVLVDRVWGDMPPDRARRALHAHMTRIRRLLESASTGDERSGEGGSEPPARLTRRSGGYLLDVALDHVDLHRFRGLVARARHPSCADVDRVALLSEALALWRGQPLAGLCGGWAVRTRHAWEQERVDAAVAWAWAELCVGDPHAVTGPLAELADEYPLAESLAAVLIRALYMAGRCAEAVDYYTVVRKRLVEELGVEPSAELRTLHQAILRGDLEAVPPAPVAVRVSPQAAAVHTPAQLPLDVFGFTGRDDQLAGLDRLLTGSSAQPTAVLISAMSGTAGVGKTALAVHWAHRVAHRFDGGQLYVNLRGFDPSGSAMAPGEAVRGFLDALGVPAQRIPTSLDAKIGLYRSLLAGRRILILLDNAATVDQVRPLLPGAPGSIAVVTSRNQLTGLVAVEGAQPLTVDLLTPAEARDLLSRRLGAQRIAAEPAAVDDIIASCARLPLALAIVAARAATHPRFPLAALAQQLRRNHGSLDAFADRQPTNDVRTVFSWSYRTLSDEAARLFRLLSLHPGPDISMPAAASLAGLPAARVRPLLAELADVHLLAEHIAGRYAFHDLLRAYAAELLQTRDGDDQRRAATRRVLDHYLHTARTGALLLYPYRDPIILAPPEPGAVPEELADHGQALAWFTAEHPVLMAIANLATTERQDARTWQLAWSLTTFFDRRGHWHDLIVTMRAGLAAARRLADRPGQAHAHRSLGHTYAQLGRYDEAYAHYRCALEVYRNLGDDTGQAHTHLNISVVVGAQDRPEPALHHAQQALELFRAAGHRSGQADALNNIGWYHAELGRNRKALAYCREALALQEELGDRWGQAATWDSLGHAHQRLGDHQQATASYHHAIRLRRDVGDRGGEADTLVNLGDAHHAAGALHAARAAWQRALAILDELDHPDADRVRAKLRHTDAPSGVAGRGEPSARDR